MSIPVALPATEGEALPASRWWFPPQACSQLQARGQQQASRQPLATCCGPRWSDKKILRLHGSQCRQPLPMLPGAWGHLLWWCQVGGATAQLPSCRASQFQEGRGQHSCNQPHGNQRLVDALEVCECNLLQAKQSMVQVTASMTCFSHLAWGCTPLGDCKPSQASTIPQPALHTASSVRLFPGMRVNCPGRHTAEAYLV